MINDAGRQAVHKKQRKYKFFGRISPNDVLYFFLITKLTGTIPLKQKDCSWKIKKYTTKSKMYVFT